MKLTIFSGQSDGAIPIAGRPLPRVTTLDLPSLDKVVPESPDSLAYLDCRGLEADAIARAVKRLKRAWPDGSWGIFDPEGRVGDPAALFRDGAGDYLGPGLADLPLDAKRCRQVLDWAGRLAVNPKEATPAASPDAEVSAKPGDFPGWKGVKRGDIRNFYLLLVTPEHQDELRNTLGEAHFSALRERLHTYMEQLLIPSDGLCWMRDGAVSLYLIPAEGLRAEKAIENCLRFLLNQCLIANEALSLSIHVPLVFALHRGMITFQEPGTTGTLVSEEVNFIFHMGAKKAKGGRVTLSKEAFPAIPSPLSSLFVPSAPFEEHEIRHSRRFI